MIVYLHSKTLNSQSKCRNITEMIEVNGRVLELNVLMDPRKGIGSYNQRVAGPNPHKGPHPHISPAACVYSLLVCKGHIHYH